MYFWVIPLFALWNYMLIFVGNILHPIYMF